MTTPTEPAPAPPAVVIMTGFARADGECDGVTWTVEVKSVNGRSLDVRCRMPAGFDVIEAAARAEIPRRIRRGNVSVSLSLGRTLATTGLSINRALLDQLLAVCADLQAQGLDPPRADGLLALRGVLEAGDEQDPTDQRRRLQEAVTADLMDALDRLAAARAAEGERLAVVLDGHLREIERLTNAARTSAAVQPAALRERLRAQVQTLLDAVPALPEDRLVQEVALLVTKSDIREELDRLDAHVAQASDLLAKGGAIGRRLDFLCQEFNREANTLCSKSADVELTRIGLALKAAVEQFREQVQNIE